MTPATLNTDQRGYVPAYHDRIIRHGSRFVVRENIDHLARVIRARRLLCFGEQVAVQEGGR